MSSRAASDYVLLRPGGTDVVLVLGMRWHTVLGSRLEQRARQRARQVRATHYAHEGNREAVGVVRLLRADRGKTARMFHSAALLFAAEHGQGTAVLCARLEDGRVWVVAAQAGKVLTQSDRVYASMDDAGDAMEELRSRYGDGMAVFESEQAFDFSAWAEHARASHRLQSCGLALPSIPRPIAVIAVAGLLAMAGRAGWDTVRGMLPKPAGVMQSVVDPDAAWTEAMAAFGGGIRLHGHADWQGMLARLVALPMELGGWRLQAAGCRTAMEGWQCEARYQRHAREATNASFLASQLPGWRVAWQPLDAAAAGFDIGAPGTALDPTRLGTRSEHERDLVTALQRLQPALSRVAWGTAGAVAIAPPRDAAGAPIPKPASQRALTARPISLEGPMRSMFALPEALPGQVEWRSVELVLDEAARPSLNRSRFMANVSGVLYAYD